MVFQSSQLMCNFIDHCLMPIVEWEPFDSDPEGDLKRESNWYDWLPKSGWLPFNNQNDKVYFLKFSVDYFIFWIWTEKKIWPKYEPYALPWTFHMRGIEGMRIQILCSWGFGESYYKGKCIFLARADISTFGALVLLMCEVLLVQKEVHFLFMHLWNGDT